MTTQITTTVTQTINQDDDYQKVITITPGEFTTAHWAATLSIEEQQEWNRQNSIHEGAVQAAVAAGDAEVTHNKNNVTIKWRNEEIHMHWMNTISAKDHASHQSFWTRYLAVKAERK
jgi:hypothetical protein